MNSFEPINPGSGTAALPAAVHVLVGNADTRLYTSLYPAPGRETVLLLHGGPGFPGDLEAVAHLLCGRFQVITFHQRGTRRSPCPGQDFSMEAYLSDIEAVRKHFGLEKMHLWGHSWGGLYAQIYAARYGAHLLSLFLCCPGSGTNTEWVQTEQEVMQLNRSKCTTWEWMMMGINSLLGMLGSDAAYKRLFRQVMKNYNAGFDVPQNLSVDLENLKAAPIRKTRPEIVRYPLLQPMPAPGFPVTIVYGDQDIYQSSKNHVIRRYPTARCVTIPRCGHLPWLHHAAAYAAALQQHYG